MVRNIYRQLEVVNINESKDRILLIDRGSIIVENEKSEGDSPF